MTLKQLTAGYTMDSNMCVKLLCLLLCTVWTVAAQNNCTTFEQVDNLDKECIDSTIGFEVFHHANLTHRLTLLCSSRSAYEICMVEKTAGCSEMSDIMAEVESSFSACSITDQWADTYLVPYLSYNVCHGNTSAIPKCFEAVANKSEEYPFSDELFKQGLDDIHTLKRMYLSCMSEWLQASDRCNDNWRQSYLSLIVRIMQSRRHFGLYLDSQDISDFERLQAEIDAQQASAQARDLFHAGLPFF